MYDTIIIGGGPAGVAAGIYAARKHLKSVLIAEKIGGQSSVSEGIENWVGSVKISGEDLAKSFESHLKAVKSDKLELALGERVVSLSKTDSEFIAITKSGKEFRAKAVMIASGAGRRKLSAIGADTFENKGVTYCASCDGPLFSGMDVAVIGGGNAGFETALQLLSYAKSVTLIHRHKEFKADAVTVAKAQAHPNMHIITNAEPTEVKGEQFVSSLVYKDKDTGETTEIPASGIFVETGVVPNTDFAKGLVEFDAVDRIVVDPHNQRAHLILQTPSRDSDARHGESGEEGVQASTTPESQRLRNKAGGPLDGVWAAGDCTDELYHQNNIAAGDGAKAMEDLYLWVKKQ
ncbi:MAG: FAD-dependent oxidoreductase [Candidatus Pacebacteria bacterium]|nr:FAD-dependent oxidoreductase [Candidatus Paceibacterota bacterium]